MASVATIGAALLASGCGYTDDNPRAATQVAQGYLDAQRSGDAQVACGLLAPETAASFTVAGGGSCEAYVDEATPPTPGTDLTAERIGDVPGPPLNPRMAFRVREQPGRVLVTGRYGSTWLVVDAGSSALGR